MLLWMCRGEWDCCRDTHTPDVWRCIKKSWSILMALLFKPWFLDDDGKACLVDTSETMFCDLILWCTCCALFRLICSSCYQWYGCNELMKWQWVRWLTGPLFRKDVESYIHRSGRTGRAGRTGICICFYQRKEEYQLRHVEQKAVQYSFPCKTLTCSTAECSL